VGKTLLPGIIVFLLCATRLSAATYYIAPSGNDGNSGTLSAPFATIQKAVTAASSGNDTIYLRAGTYNQGTNISSKSGITISNYNGESAILDGTGASYSVFFYDQ
jgi:pectin methylesterase-like acyl-CoA thioesterase